MTPGWVRAFVLVCGLGTAVPAAAQPDVDWQTLGTVLDFIRARNARDYAVTGPNAVDEGIWVSVGGIEQWITIRGENRDNPVVLFLHGGPGDATNPWGYAGFRPWLSRYTVVQWDQRGAGRTLGKNGPDIAATITLERMIRDGNELADWIKARMAKDKIILVGHSFGSILGAMMAKARPELYYAYVGTGQVGDPSHSYTVAHRELLKRAESLGDAAAFRELQAIGPPPYRDGRGFAVQRKWSNFFEGADRVIASMLGFALSAPGYTMRDVNDWLDGQRVSADRLVPETSALPASALEGDYKVPVFVIEGEDDFTTPASLARAFVDHARAPRKGFIGIDGGHFAVFTHTDQFLKALDERVRPLAR